MISDMINQEIIILEAYKMTSPAREKHIASINATLVKHGDILD